MLLIQEILITATLKEFYYAREMSEEDGIIINHIAGALIYDTIDAKTKIEISKEDKLVMWAKCKKTYLFWYAQYKDYSKEEQKKLLDRYFKSTLCEFYLNRLAEEGEIMTMGKITDILGIKNIIVK
jgi:hypothetical protein